LRVDSGVYSKLTVAVDEAVEQPKSCAKFLQNLEVRFFSTGISGTISGRFLLQTGSKTTTATRHHNHHFPTLPLEHPTPTYPHLPTYIVLHNFWGQFFGGPSNVTRGHCCDFLIIFPTKNGASKCCLL
jgi:hypothetical protein